MHSAVRVATYIGRLGLLAVTMVYELENTGMSLVMRLASINQKF